MRAGETLGDARQAIAVAGRLAGEQQGAAGCQHARELAESARQVGDVVQHGVAQHEVEARVLEGQPLGVRDDGLHLQPKALGVGAQRGQHSGGDVRASRVLDQPGAQHVQREVPRPGADLQRARVAPGTRAQDLADLDADLLQPDVAEVDPPLGVVVVGGHVVVAGVDVADLLRGERWRHGRAP